MPSYKKIPKKQWQAIICELKETSVMEEKMKKQDTQEDVQVKTEEELSQVAGGGATRRSPGKPIMPVKSGEKK